MGPETNFEKLYYVLQSKFGGDSDKLRMYFDGATLDFDQTPSDHGLKDGDIIHILKRLLIPRFRPRLAVCGITPYLDNILGALGLHTEARTSFITYWFPSLLKHTHVTLRFVARSHTRPPRRAISLHSRTL
ncbi:hypothetical protein MVEN_00282500 [Mycena venus]|uniref:Ubiquitin-like domain-containing protein n=1 Tax=Mycena venus TaxID=2733690 RepID=A0A8H6Z2B1_9AGAR|nr:hypothetical protein MVEN_00282500 [Mycena venus]